MSTYLICSTPAHGHVLPLLTVASHLRGQGHRVLFLTSTRYAARVETAGAEFLALPDAADVDLDNATSFPGREGLTGPAALRFDMSNLFLRPGAAQFAELRRILAAQPVDAVLVEPLFVGAALLAELPRSERPPIVALGIFPLGVKSRDTAPFGLGIAPLAGPVGRARNALLSVVSEKIVFASVGAEANALAQRVVGRPLSRFFLDWHSGADAVVQFTVPDFEYPRSDLPTQVSFMGPLPPTSSSAPLPEWWSDLDAGAPVVHVTQGTIANADPSQLIAPTIAALGDSDVLVVVSTGGADLAEQLGSLPANVRVAPYLPYELLLPRVSVMITNGGYGGVQQALAHGIPLVVAGQTEDKVEVTARVAWSGAGVNLRTNRPTAAAIGEAVRHVRHDPRFARRAGELAAAFADAPGLAGLDDVLDGLVESARARR